jgi:ribosomal protein S18 acetylase RimI-like enzyme
VTIAYRRPRINEARALAELHIACWREAYADIVPAAILDAANVDSKAESWRRTIGNEAAFPFTAYDGDTPVGFVISGRPNETLFEDMDGQIAALYVLRSHHMLGIGTYLLGAAARHWLERDGHSLALGVLAQNAGARLFYEALGARLVKAGTFNWHGFDIPDVIYVFEDLLSLLARGGSPPLR